MLELCGLCAGYGAKQVLHDVSLDIPAGKVTVIVGPNGCGKSTLLKTLAGLLPKTSGTVRIDGQDTAKLSPRQLAQQLSYLPQDRQIPDITALRMVLHGRFPYLSYPRRYRQEDLEAARAAMEKMGIADLQDAPVSTLSGGTRQKVYIAMALAQDTPVILMDEPTTFLDISHQLQTMQQARQLAETGKTVVLVLHDLLLAMQHADRIAVMEDGRTVQAGSPETVLDSGCVERVFGVRLCRFRTECGWKYYYEGD